jgi:hypothetical protein
MKILRKLIQLLPKLGSKKNRSRRFIDDWEYNSIKKSKQDEIDRILDKISKSGTKSLSKKELDFLNSYNKKSL